MKAILASLFLFLPLQTYSADFPRHMIVMTTDGLGAYGSYEKIDPEENSQFDDFNITKGNVAFNYAYTLTPKFQLGGFISNHSEVRRYETKHNGPGGKVKYHTLYLGLIGIWNFSENLVESWYTGLILSHFNDEEEFSHNVFGYLEDDKNSLTAEVMIGKRLSLKKWGLENITYSPSFSIFASHSTKDYDDDGLEKSYGINFEVIKFDVLF